MSKLSKEEVLLNLAQRVKILRKQKGVTQQEAYIDTGIQFSRIEQGKRDIQLSTLNSMCTYFEIELKDFFEGHIQHYKHN